MMKVVMVVVMVVQIMMMILSLLVQALKMGKAVPWSYYWGGTCKYLQLHKVEGGGGPQSQNLSPNLSPYLLKLWKLSSHL